MPNATSPAIAMDPDGDFIVVWRDEEELPNVRQPMILNTEMEATRQAFTAPEFSYWLRPSSELQPRSAP